MPNQSDHGFQVPATSMRCLACGSTEVDCCDGEGGTLPEPVKLLFRIKRDLEQQRRFGIDTLTAWRNKLVYAEGDIEEWLIENGYIKTLKRKRG